jgi:hypothetical protein
MGGISRAGNERLRVLPSALTRLDPGLLI